MAVASAVWLVFLLFSPMWLPAPKHGADPPVISDAPFFLLTFATGVFLAVKLQHSAAARARLWVAVAWLAALLLYCVGTTFAANLTADSGWRISLLIPTLGALVGFLTSWALVQVLLPNLQRTVISVEPIALLGFFSLFFLPVYALTPLQPELPATEALTVGSADAYLQGLMGRIYLLIKSAILWVPLGLISVVAGFGALAALWSLAGAVIFFLLVLPFLLELNLRELLEVPFALVGIQAGLWLGTRLVMDRPEPPRVEAKAHSAPSPPPAAPPKAWSASNLIPDIRLQRLMLRLPFVLAAVGLAIWLLSDFPRWQLSLAIGLVAYFLVLLRFRHAWLLLVPALLPTLDLAPWTGRFFFDEFDLLMLVTLATAVLHGRHKAAAPFVPRSLALMLSLFALLSALALFRGLTSLPPLDFNAVDNYLSPLNSLRVGKGFLWGFVLLGLMRWTLPAGEETPRRLFTAGLLLGLVWVAMVGLRERWQFADLLDFSLPYRITATFSSMHTGGAHLPAYLALTVPFIWYWVTGARRLLPALAGGTLLLTLGAYLVISTVTRASVFVLAIELILILIFWLKGRGGRAAGGGLRAVSAVATMLIAASVLLAVGIGGDFFQHRLSQAEKDMGWRLQHWQHSLRMRDDGILNAAFGAGLGRFPEAYVFHNRDGDVPAMYSFAEEGSNTYLLLGSGQTLYLAQKVPVRAMRSYRLAFDLRSPSAETTLGTPICEKHLLDSHRCRWMSHKVPGGGGAWHRIEKVFDSGEIGEGDWPARRPVELSLYNPGKDITLALDNISLKDAGGTELLRNGDFHRGGDFWFFKTHDHLAWHIKNIWVSALFELGWAGMVLFTLVVITLLIRLGGRAWRLGDPASATVFTAITGFLLLGLFSSPFDAPRITVLFFAVAGFGLWCTSARNPTTRFSSVQREASIASRSNWIKTASGLPFDSGH